MYTYTHIYIYTYIYICIYATPALMYPRFLPKSYRNSSEPSTLKDSPWYL